MKDYHRLCGEVRQADAARWTGGDQPMVGGGEVLRACASTNFPLLAPTGG